MRWADLPQSFYMDYDAMVLLIHSNDDIPPLSDYRRKGMSEPRDDAEETYALVDFHRARSPWDARIIAAIMAADEPDELP